MDSRDVSSLLACRGVRQSKRIHTYRFPQSNLRVKDIVVNSILNHRANGGYNVSWLHSIIVQ